MFEADVQLVRILGSVNKSTGMSWREKYAFLAILFKHKWECKK